MECELVQTTWLKREFCVTVDGTKFQVLYNGREMGSEHVYVDGEEVAGAKSRLWFIPSFRFQLSGKDARIDVSVWPWLYIRSFSFTVDGRTLYEE